MCVSHIPRTCFVFMHKQVVRMPSHGKYCHNIQQGYGNRSEKYRTEHREWERENRKVDCGWLWIISDWFSHIENESIANEMELNEHSMSSKWCTGTIYLSIYAVEIQCSCTQTTVRCHPCFSLLRPPHTIRTHIPIRAHTHTHTATSNHIAHSCTVQAIKLKHRLWRESIFIYCPPSLPPHRCRRRRRFICAVHSSHKTFCEYLRHGFGWDYLLLNKSVLLFQSIS